MKYRLFVTFFSLFVGVLSGVPSQWTKPPLTIAPGLNPDNYGPAQVGVDGSGNSYAVWVGNVTVGSSVFSGIYAAILPFGASNWSVSPPLWTPTSQETEAAAPQISVIPSGQAIAVWCVGCFDASCFFSTHTYQIFYSIYDGSGWSTAAPIDLSFGSDRGSFPNVALAPSGDGIAVWDVGDFQAGRPINRAVVSSYDATSKSWTTSYLSSDSLLLYTLPQIGIDAAGNGVAVWQREPVAGTVVVEANRSPFTNPPIQLATESVTGFTTRIEMDPKIAVNSSGEAIAVWDFFDDAAETYRPQAKTFKNGVWSLPTDLYGTSTSLEPTFPEIALNANGHAVAVWSVGDTIYAARRNPKGKWSEDVEINNDGLGVTSLNPQVAIDAQGQAVVVYMGEIEGVPRNTYEVIAQISDGLKNRWKSQVELTTSPTDSYALPQVATNAEGDATAVWTIGSFPFDSSGTVQSSSIILAPRNAKRFKGSVISNTFPMQTECVHTLTWQASSDGSIVKYVLFAGNQVIGTFPNNQANYTFEIRDACCGKSTTYKLFAVNADGIRSQPLKIVL